jgi:MFS family permease
MFRTFADDVPAVIACRVFMLLGSFAIITLSAVSMAYTADKVREWPAHAHFLLNPAAASSAIGGCSIVTGLVGLMGGLHASRPWLLAFIFLQLIAVTLTLYLSVLCFLSAATVSSLTTVVASYVQGMPAQGALVASGAACAVAAAMQVGAAASAARVAEWRWTLRRLPALLTAVNFVLAAVLLSLAAYANTTQRTVNTQFAVVFGVFGILVSLLGAGAAYTTRLERAVVVLTMLVGFLGSLVASACIAAGNVRSVCPSTTAQLDTDRLLLLGAFAVITAAARFAESAALLRELVLDASDDEQLLPPRPRSYKDSR